MRNYLAPAVAILASLTLTACAKKPTPQMPAPMVSVAAPLQAKVVDWDDFSGRFEAPEKVEVRARAGGYLQAAHFKDGQLVKKGQLLFTLDPRPAEAQLAAARAQAEEARAALKRAQSLLAVQAISKEDYEGRKAAAQIADATVRARQLDVEFTRVTAPISGMVSYRRIDPGNVIAGGSSTGDVLTTIVSVNPIHFVFDASEAQILKYQRQAQGRNGAAVRIGLQDEVEPRWSGKVDFLDNAVDDATGAMRLRAVVANPNGFLKPGMFGRARMVGSQAYTALLIPDAAVVSDGLRKTAIVVDPSGQTHIRPLELGPVVNGLRVVRSGLSSADQVIVNGVQRVRPGQKVQTKATTITRGAATPPPARAESAPPASSATLAD
jgi:RND family efflux transporter MFP subunit